MFLDVLRLFIFRLRKKRRNNDDDLCVSNKAISVFVHPFHMPSLPFNPLIGGFSAAEHHKTSMFSICNIISASCNLEVDLAAVFELTTGGKCVEQQSYKKCVENKVAFG